MSARKCLSLSHTVLFLFQSLPLARSIALSSNALPYNNNTSPTPTRSAANATHLLAAADKCWSQWENYSAATTSCALTTTDTSITTFTDTDTAVQHLTYSLCDGHPRANASGGEWTSRTTLSESGTPSETRTEVLPPSGIPEATMTTVFTTAMTFFETACANPPAAPTCEVGEKECKALFSSWTAGSFTRGKPPCTMGLPQDPCDECRIYVPTVKLMYFPVTMMGDFCGNDYAPATPTPQANMSIPSTVVSNNYTFTSGFAYLSYAGVTAHAGDDLQCGTPLGPGILAVPSTRLSTYRGHAAAMPIQSLPPHSLNFGDLAPNPVPWDAWISQELCYNHQDYPQCQTITDAAYRPWIVYPTEFWEMGDPRWTGCVSDAFGIMDPPSALAQAGGVAMPTAPTQVETTAAATTRKEGDGDATSTKAEPSKVAPRPTADPTGIDGPTQETKGDAGGPAATNSDAELTVTGSNVPSATSTQNAANGEHGDPAEPTSEITATFTFDPTAAGPEVEETASAGPSSGDPVASAIVSGLNPPDNGNEGSDFPQTRTGGAQNDVAPVQSTAAGSGGQHDSATATPDEEEQDSPSAPAPAEQEPPMTAPALSILASALSPIASDANPSEGSAMSSVLSAAESVLSLGDGQSTHHAASTRSKGDNLATWPVMTLGGSEYTAIRNSDHLILGSATLSIGKQTTISDVPVAVYSDALLIGSTFVPLARVSGENGSGATRTVSQMAELPSVVVSSSSPGTTESTNPPQITTASTESRSTASGAGESSSASGRGSITTLGNNEGVAARPDMQRLFIAAGALLATSFFSAGCIGL